jgi:pyroglutamyl-peptidase
MTQRGRAPAPYNGAMSDNARRARAIILVTGFGAFPGAPFNPSAAIVSRLGERGRRRLAALGVRLETRILPVIFEGAEDRLSALVSETRPDAVLHIGLAGRRRALGVETRAKNVISRLHPDAARRFAGDRRIEPGGPMTRAARLPVARIVTALARAGAAARPSIDAGTYACNQTLFCTLARDVPLAGFIHVPRPRGRRRLDRVKTPARPTLAAMARGIEDVLMLIATELRRAR